MLHDGMHWSAHDRIAGRALYTTHLFCCWDSLHLQHPASVLYQTVSAHDCKITLKDDCTASLCCIQNKPPRTCCHVPSLSPPAPASNQGAWISLAEETRGRNVVKTSCSRSLVADGSVYPPNHPANKLPHSSTHIEDLLSKLAMIIGACPEVDIGNHPPDNRDTQTA